MSWWRLLAHNLEHVLRERVDFDVLGLFLEGNLKFKNEKGIKNEQKKYI